MLYPRALSPGDLGSFAELALPLSHVADTVVVHRRRRCFGLKADPSVLADTLHVTGCGRCAPVGVDELVGALADLSLLEKSLKEEEGHWGAARLLLKHDPAWQPGNRLLPETMHHPVMLYDFDPGVLRSESQQRLGELLRGMLDTWRLGLIADKPRGVPKTFFAATRELRDEGAVVLEATPRRVVEVEGRRYVLATTSLALPARRLVVAAADPNWEPELGEELWPLVVDGLESASDLADLVGAVSMAALPAKLA